MMRHVLGAMAFVAGVAMASCSKDDPPGGVGIADDGDADSDVGDASTTDAPPFDAIDGPSDTALVATINGVTRTLDRAQFGTETNDAGSPAFYVEAHSGGDPSCPDPDGGGATPDRTLVVNGIPRGTPGKSYTQANGITAAYLDFEGKQLTGPSPLTKATAVTVTILAIDANQTPDTIDFDVEATFAEGTVKGRVHAEYCDSLSQ